MWDFLKYLLTALAGFVTGRSSQRAADIKAGEEDALKAEQARKQSDAKIDADSNADDLDWLRRHGTSASGDKP